MIEGSAAPGRDQVARRGRGRPAFGLLIAATFGFRAAREVVERVAFSRYGVLGFVAVVLIALSVITAWRVVLRYRTARVGREFSAASVVAQVEQSDLGRPAFPGDGTLLGAPIMVVNQLAKVIEVNTEYSLYDEAGAPLGSVVQVGQSRAKQAVRFVLPIDQYLTHRFEVRDAAGDVVLNLHRPWKIFKTRLIVRDGRNRPVGEISQDNIFWKIHFSLIDTSGRTVGRIAAKNLRAWDFAVEDVNGDAVATLYKSWEGWARAALTRADHFVVRIERPLDEPLRSLTVAASLAVDVALKQDNRR